MYTCYALRTCFVYVSNTPPKGVLRTFYIII